MTTDTLDLPPIDTTPIAAAASTALAPLDFEKLDLAKLAVAKFGDWRGDVAKARKTLDGAVHDLTTQAKVDEAKSLRFRLIGQPRADARKVSKALKSKLAAVSKIVGAEEDAAVAAYDSAETLITPQIEAREVELAAEKAEAARVLAERQQKQAEGVAGIRAYLSRAQTVADMTAARVAAGIKMLEGMTFTADDWMDPVAAANAQCETVEGMRALHGTLLAREAEAARLEAQRVEQERQAAELAAAQAKLQAEQQRIAKLQAMVAEIRAAATGHDNASAADLSKAIVAVKALDVSEAHYQEFTPLAEAAQDATLAALQSLHLRAVEREEIEAAQRASTLAANVATAAATEGKADNPEPGTLEAAPEFTEGQDDQQVLKAEPATADATAGSVPADASPRVGAMGAGQAADTAPAADQTAIDAAVKVQMDAVYAACVPMQAGTYPGAIHVDPATGDQSRITLVVSAPLPEPTMTLGEFNTFIAPLRIDGAGLESLGFPAAGRRKAAMLYHDTDKARMVAAMVKHLQGLR